MIWDYDVMMHGTWDANEWNAINNNAVASGTSHTGEGAEGNASKNIIVNDPKIDIQKSVDKLEYKVR